MDLEVEVKEELVWLEGTESTSLDSHVHNAAENDNIIKVESQTSITPKVEKDPLDPRTEDDITVEDFEVPSVIACSKEETKSELRMPGPTQQNLFQPSADVKDEIFIEEHTADQLNPCFKEEKNLENSAVLTRSPLHECDGCCKTLDTNSVEKCNFPADNKERPYRCTVCSSSFTRKGDLSSHKFSHSGERPHTCKECGNSFIRKSHLNTHLLIHAGQRPFHCTECKSSFSQKSTLLNHMSTHSGERPFRCNICSSTFSRKSNLKQHELIHSGERPYRCNICFKTFSWKSILKTHLLTHSGERPFCCNVCNSTFSQRGHLRQHQLSHSDARPHGCPICNAMFCLRSSLKRHLLTHRAETLSDISLVEISVKQQQISENVRIHEIK